MIDVPLLRLELTQMKLSMLQALETRWLDLENCLNAGIDQAQKELPMLIAARMRDATLRAVDDAVTSAVKAYFTQGEGYDKIAAYIAERMEKSLAV